MPRRTSSHPTQAELEIMQVIWTCGPSTVREVHQVLQRDRRTALTTTLKLMQIMTGKGLLRSDDQRPARFSTVQAREKTQVGLLRDLAQRAFDGSLGKLLVRAVADTRLKPDELDAIRQLIDQNSGKSNPPGKRGGQ